MKEIIKTGLRFIQLGLKNSQTVKTALTLLFGKCSTALKDMIHDAQLHL